MKYHECKKQKTKSSLQTCYLGKVTDSFECSTPVHHPNPVGVNQVTKSVPAGSTARRPLLQAGAHASPQELWVNLELLWLLIVRLETLPKVVVVNGSRWAWPLQVHSSTRSPVSQQVVYPRSTVLQHRPPPFSWASKHPWTYLRTRLIDCPPKVSLMPRYTLYKVRWRFCVQPESPIARFFMSPPPKSVRWKVAFWHFGSA